MGNNNIQSQLHWAKQQIPDIDAEVLLAFVLKKNRAYLFTWPEKFLSELEQSEFEKLIHQRLSGVPIAYLIHNKEFWSLDLKTNPAVLIPRPETELLVESVLNFYPKDLSIQIADFGTGSGAIAIALSQERPNWEIFAIDQSISALKLAQENAELHHCENITFLNLSWRDPLSIASFKNLYLDAIVSNPPYLANTDPHLNQGDLRFEPQSALISGQTGLEDFELIIHAAKNLLTPEGILFFEHGYQQAESLNQLLSHSGYIVLNQLQDLAGLDRVMVARRDENHLNH